MKQILRTRSNPPTVLLAFGGVYGLNHSYRKFIVSQVRTVKLMERSRELSSALRSCCRSEPILSIEMRSSIETLTICGTRVRQR